MLNDELSGKMCNGRRKLAENQSGNDDDMELEKFERLIVFIFSSNMCRLIVDVMNIQMNITYEFVNHYTQESIIRRNIRTYMQ